MLWQDPLIWFPGIHLWNMSAMSWNFSTREEASCDLAIHICLFGCPMSSVVPDFWVDLDRIHLMKSHCYSICTQKSLEPRTVSEQLHWSLSTATGISHHSETHNALPRSMSEMSTFKTDAKSIVLSMLRLSQDVCLHNADMHSAVWPHRQE